MMLERVHSFISNLRSRRTSQGRMRVSLQETGFQLHSTDQRDQSPTCFKWQEITTVLAYKRDCFAIDLICLAVADSLTVLEINEQDAGWDEFIRALENNLPAQLHSLHGGRCTTTFRDKPDDRISQRTAVW